MLNRSTPILLDTTAILEAHEADCWRALAGQYRFETVEQCVIETQTGYQHRNPEVQIDEQVLRSQLHAVHRVTEAELAKVYVSKGGLGLHEGEQALWAHALGRDDFWILCGPDRASMKFGADNKCRDRLISLGELASRINLRVKLQDHHTKPWLDGLLANHALGIL